MDVRAYLTLEQQLIRRLGKTWATSSAETLRQLDSQIESGDYDGARATALDLSLADVGQKNEQFIRYLLRSCMLYGAMNVADVPGVLLDPQTDTFLDRATSTMNLYFANGGTLLLQREVLQSIAQKERTQKAERKVKDFVSFKAGMDKVQLISSLHSSRLAVWGFTAEAEVVGVSRYKLNAVMDGRTSAFCRWIHGKEFSVADARKKITEVLAAQDPNDLKTLQPWPDQSKASMEVIRGMDEQQLVDAGWCIPPFHPGCRTVCVLVSRLSRLEKPAPIIAVPDELPHSLTTEQAFKEIGIELTPKQLDHWNAYVGVSPAEWLSKLAGVDPLKALEGVFGKNAIKITATGDVLTKVKGTFGGSKFFAGTVLDPYSGTLYLSQADFVAADIGASLKFFKSLLKNLVTSGVSIAAKTVVVEVGHYAYAYGKFGFLPSPAKWQQLRMQLQDDLLEGQYQKAMQSLTDEQQQLLLNLLSNPSEQAFGVLADLTWKYRGKYIGELLLDGVDGAFDLDLTNQQTVNKIMGYLH